MSSLLGNTQGKSRSESGYNAGPLKSINRQLVSTGGVRDVNNALLSQISEAMRTGGIGAQIPMIQQAVSGANQATSQALRGTESSLAASGLQRTPYGQSTLAQTRLSGAQTAARIPTDYAQQVIAGAPQFSSGLLQQILGSLQHTTSKSGSYST